MIARALWVIIENWAAGRKAGLIAPESRFKALSYEFFGG